MKKIIIATAFILPVFVSASFDVNLRYGSSGSDVTALQDFLIKKGFLNVSSTGNFLSLTKKALVSYQSSVGVPATGYFGPMTREKINKEISSNSTSSSVVAFPNSNYYLPFLPYISKTVESTPIQLPNITLDPTSYKPLLGSGFKNEYISPDQRLYMIQYKAQSSKQYTGKNQLRRMVGNVYIITASDEELIKLIGDESVNFVDDYHPHYKLDPELVNAYYNLTITPSLKLKVVFSSLSSVDEMNHAASVVPVSIMSINAQDHSMIVSGLTDRQQLFTLANNPLITEIGLVR